MNKVIKLTIAVVISILMLGCASNTPEMRAEQSQDKMMSNAFSSNLPRHEEINRFISEPDEIAINHYIDREVGTGKSVNESIRKYRAYTDSSKDELSKRYIKVAKSRGNTVKMYNARVNEFLGKITPLTAKLLYDGPRKYDEDNAFIEFDKNGRIVSMMIRKHIYPRIGNFVSNYRVTHILFGKWASIAETRLSNSFLSDGYIATM